MNYRIAVSLPSQRDFRKIKRYISLDSLSVAKSFTTLLRSKTKVLALHPKIGRVVPEFDDFSVREIVVGNYCIIYEVDSLKKQIIILRYWHAARGEPNV